MKFKILILLLVYSFSSLAQKGQRDAAYLFNKKLGRGVNFMGSKINNDYHDLFDFQLIKQNKFTHIRIGSRMWQYTGDAPEYTIDAQKLESYKNAVDWALDNGLMVIADPIHAWDDYTDVDLPKLTKLWQQIADYFADYPLDKVAFEILNEPRNQNVDIELLTNQGINTIRNSTGNEERIIIVSGKGFSTRNALINAFNDNVFPSDDNYLIGTFHYYDPKTFTKQGHDGYDLAFWADEGDNDAEWDETINKFEEVVTANNNWATINSTEPLPVCLGEYGVDNGAPTDDRIKWLWWVRMISEQNSFSHTLWNLYGNASGSKGLGPWTQLEKDNPTLRTLDQNVLGKYRNRYEGEQATINSGFEIESISGSSDGQILSSYSGVYGDNFVINDVYIGRSGSYDVTLRYQNNSSTNVKLFIASSTNTQVIESLVLNLLPSNEEWNTVTIPLQFQVGINNKIIFELRSNATSFYFDYLAITKGCFYDNLFPSICTNAIISNVSNSHNNDISVYPNPSSSTVKIKGEFKQWKLYNTCGKKLLSGNNKQIDIVKMEKGIYILEIDNYKMKLIIN